MCVIDYISVSYLQLLFDLQFFGSPGMIGNFSCTGVVGLSLTPCVCAREGVRA